MTVCSLCVRNVLVDIINMYNELATSLLRSACFSINHTVKLL